MLVWVTRSSPYNLLTAHRLRAVGHKVVTSPVLRVGATKPHRIEGRPDALVFTSSHGVRHHLFQPELRDVPVFTVGDHTARTARRRGYHRVRSARGNVLNLQKLIVQEMPSGARIVHFAAERPAGDLAGYLRSLGYGAERQVVYRSEEADWSELDGALAVLPAVEAITVHSPRGAKRVADVIRSTGWHGELICISEACASAFEGLGGLVIETAGRPEERSLLSLLGVYADQKPRSAAPRRAGNTAVALDPMLLPSADAWSSAANDNCASPASSAEPGETDGPPPSAA